MTDLLKDILHTLNALPDRKVKGKDFTTYELAKRVEQELELLEIFRKSQFPNLAEDRTFRK